MLCRRSLTLTILALLSFPLAAALYQDSHPVHSPDGRLIAFESRRAGHLQAMIMNADGSEQRVVADHALDSGYPRWFPDGKRLSFHARIDGPEWQVFTVRVDGSDLRQVTRGFAYIFEGTPSPDGLRLAMIGRRESDPEGATHLYVLDLESERSVRLTSDHSRKYHPTWSPDGSRIAYGAQSLEGNFEIFTIDAGGGLPERITHDITWDRMQPSWSRDGRWIAHTCSDEAGRSLCLVDLDSKKVTEIEAARALKPWRPDWSPDGRRIVFDGNRHGELDIFSVDLGTGSVRRVTSKPDPPFVVAARRGNLDQALAEKDKHAGAMVMLTEELMAKNDLAGAIRVASANVKEAPDAGTYQILGDVLRRQGKYAPPDMHRFMTLLRRDGSEPALALYREARTLHPGWLLFPAMSMSRHGYLYLGNGDLPRAKAAFQMLIDSYPDNSWGYEGLARVLRAQGNVEAANRAEERAKEIDSQSN